MKCHIKLELSQNNNHERLCKAFLTFGIFWKQPFPVHVGLQSPEKVLNVLLSPCLTQGKAFHLKLKTSISSSLKRPAWMHAKYSIRPQKPSDNFTRPLERGRIIYQCNRRVRETHSLTPASVTGWPLIVARLNVLRSKNSPVCPPELDSFEKTHH